MRGDDGFDLVLTPTASLASGRYPGLEPQIVEHDAFVKHKDVSVRLRDGATIYVDLFLPHQDAPAPALVAWSPYGKHGLKSLAMMPGADVDPSWVSAHAIWEGPDPGFWCKRGYAVVAPDPRGAWSSEGTLTIQSHSEADDGCDLIEWIAQQSWSNGKVGMLGVSYLAISQWMIAARRPPSLCAICPWEGLSDPYREVYLHGGIPERRFMEWWQPKSLFSLNPAEDMIAMIAQHPLRDAYWQSKQIDLEAIEIPAYVVASWGDHGMHTRGSLEGFRRIGSRDKWLEVHAQKKWQHYHHPESVERQAKFFDHYLLGRTSGLKSWPRVSIEIRESNARSFFVEENSWPPRDTERLDLHLNCGTRSLNEAPPSIATTVELDLEGRHPLVFNHCFREDTIILGGSGLHLHVVADDQDDADLFVAFRKLDADRGEVGFRFYATYDAGPVALGWLRASHRETSAESSALVPAHDHVRRLPLTPGEPTLLDIEIWPTGTMFRAGETLQLLIGGRDLYQFDTGAPELGHATINRGRVRIVSTPERASFLAIPVRRSFTT